MTAGCYVGAWIGGEVGSALAEGSSGCCAVGSCACAGGMGCYGMLLLLGLFVGILGVRHLGWLEDDFVAAAQCC